MVSAAIPLELYHRMDTSQIMGSRRPHRPPDMEKRSKTSLHSCSMPDQVICDNYRPSDLCGTESTDGEVVKAA